MAYARRLRGKGKRYRRKSSRRYGKQFSRAVHRVLTKTAEKKFLINKVGTGVTGDAPLAVDNVGVQFYVTNIPIGDTQNEREGNEAIIRSVELGYTLRMGGTNFQNNTVRCFVYQWVQASTGSEPTLTDVMEDDTSGVTGGYLAPMSAWNHDKRFSYRILYDSGPMVLSVAGRSAVSHHLHLKKFPRRKVLYEQGDTDGSLATNHIYVAFVADTSSSIPTVSYYTKLNFSDF